MWSPCRGGGAVQGELVCRATRVTGVGRSPAPQPQRYSRSSCDVRCAAQHQELQWNGDASPSGSVSRNDYSKFVRFLHMASPYVVGHRGRTFVIVLPGEVVARKEVLYPLLEDILLLHGLGTRLVIVCGATAQIDAYLERQGRPLGRVGAYRVTDAFTLAGAIEAAGATITEISAQLSRAPSIPMIRRHARGGGGQMHFGPAVAVVSGNYVTAKRRGIVGGVDFGLMGAVRFVQREAVQQQLDGGSVVLLTNVGISASGELLNCNAFDVATHAAVELKADKLLCLTGEEVRELELPHYLPLDDAEGLIMASVCGSDLDCVLSNMDTLADAPAASASSSSASSSSSSAAGSAARNGSAARGEMSLDLDSWQQIGFPAPVVAAVVACKNGVKRAHLVDADSDGALLLELYTRDGTPGVCMIAADLYEGIRPAEGRDVPGVAGLLRMLSQAGFPLPFAPEHLPNHLPDVTVIEREGKVLGCACTRDLGTAPDGVLTAELGAFVVDPSYRRAGFGDSLLDYVEQGLRGAGFRRVAVVAGQGSYDWFSQRDFLSAGDARACELLPLGRRQEMEDGGTAAKLYYKALAELDTSTAAVPAGKRIGF